MMFKYIYNVILLLAATFCWDLENPLIITLPSHNPEVQNDVRCIAAVKDRVWVGAGPSIFFLSAENLQREVITSTHTHIHTLTHTILGPIKKAPTLFL